MMNGEEAITGCGFVKSHGDAFQEVANRNSWIIMSRDLNKECGFLLEENYASKGFHVKAKSCDWGPMAGFVLHDPHFSKGAASTDPGKRAKAIEFNEKNNAKSMSEILEGQTWADRLPLRISTARLQDLLSRGKMTSAGSNKSSVLGSLVSNTKITESVFVQCPNPAGGVLFFRIEAACHDRLEPRWRILMPLPGNTGWMPVYAMMNKDPNGQNEGNKHLNAITGDYDLFAVYTRKVGGRSMNDKLFEATENKNRGWNLGPKLVPKNPGPLVQSGAAALTKSVLGNLNKDEDPHMGNLSNVIRQAKDAINAAVNAKGYKGGNVVHHSDDAYNPFSGAPTFPLLAFRPNLPALGIETPQELMQAWSDWEAGYAVYKNPGWKIRYDSSADDD
jgi:Anthrax toxin LF subunit